MHEPTIRVLIATCVALTLSACDDDELKISSEDRNDAGSACSAPAETEASANASLTLASAAVPPGGAAVAVIPAYAGQNFARPLAVKIAPDNDQCLYVVEQAGIIKAIPNDENSTEQNIFVDLTNRVDSGPNEAGLLGMAFHPDYARNGEVFLSYTGNDEGLVSYISRFQTTNGGRTLNKSSEEVLLMLRQPFSNHNGGNIAFGPDGYLYIGFGDGGFANDPGARTQNTQNLFGSLLRIDVDGGTPYGIPGDNIFAGNELCNLGEGAADCPELYALGLRNPWRWTFDRDTGDIWLGDVGQGQLEEIDIIDLGGNYGWPFYEGTRCNPNAPVVDCDFPGLLPVTEYGRDKGRSVTGGYVYRGSAIPDLVGVYVYADFASGTLFQYFDDEGEIITQEFATGLNIASFAETLEGELLIVDLIGGGLHRIVGGD